MPDTRHDGGISWVEDLRREKGQYNMTSEPEWHIVMSTTPYCLTDKPESSAGSFYARVWKWGSWSHSGTFWNVGTMVNPSLISDLHPCPCKASPKPSKMSFRYNSSQFRIFPSNQVHSIHHHLSSTAVKTILNVWTKEPRASVPCTPNTQQRHRNKISVSKEGNQGVYKLTGPQHLKPS